ESQDTFMGWFLFQKRTLPHQRRWSYAAWDSSCVWFLRTDRDDFGTSMPLKSPGGVHFISCASLPETKGTNSWHLSDIDCRSMWRLAIRKPSALLISNQRSSWQSTRSLRPPEEQRALLTVATGGARFRARCRKTPQPLRPNCGIPSLTPREERVIKMRFGLED